MGDKGGRKQKDKSRRQKTLKKKNTAKAKKAKEQGPKLVED